MNENQLIFLISQPRSGSTLLQKLLGAHSRIYTRSEPWLMLPPAYSLKQSGVNAEYNFKLGCRGLEDFWSGLPKGKETYLQELKKMHSNLYAHYLKGTNCHYFLDKTPRYYLIINELIQIFPNAKFILLIRNPLAVLGSIINTWTKDNWNELSGYKYDLFDAIETYIDAIDKKNKNILIVHYEELLQNDRKVLINIFSYLNLDDENVSEKYYKNREKWQYGDQMTVYKEKGIKKNNDTKWQKGLNNEQYWRVMYDYLQYIGKEKLKKIGYNFDKLKKRLNDRKPNDLESIINNTKSLECLLKDFNDVVKIQQENKLLINKLNTTKVELSSTTQQLSSTTQQLSSTTQQLSSTTQQLLATRNHLNSVYGSREWRIGVKLQKIFKNIFPANTLRRKYLVKCVNCFKKNVRLLKQIKTFIYIFVRSTYCKLKPKKRRRINKKSKKLVYVGHSYHNKTKSTIFLQKYLQKYFDVNIISDNSWQGDKYPDLSFVNDNYVGVLFFQILPPKEILDKINNNNIIFCPMYDASGNLDFNYWDQYRNLKMLNFSSTLHTKLKKWGFESMYIQYFPKVNEFIAGKKDEVFFWQRLTNINIKTITGILKNQKIKIHIHKAIDPRQEFLEPSKKEEKIYNITHSKWFDTREEMQEVIKQKAIYIAPREYEGIGQSFIEAMAMGKAVIGVNNPTMNEYIKHNETGYLFNLKNPSEIDLSNIVQVQENAYNYMKDGRKKWETNRKKIIDFIKKD